MPGAQIQLAAYGAQDVYLTGNPQMTHFVTTYKRYTNFALELIQQLFIGDATFGKKVYCKLDRIGDLVSRIYIDIKLPNLNDIFCIEDEHKPFQILGWINKIGHAIIDYCEIEIGGTKIDKHYGLWLEIWSELSLDCCKKDAYNMMTGRNQFNNVIHNQGAMELRIPLKFWFCRNIGLALPIIALQYHEVNIIVAFKKFAYIFNKISNLSYDDYIKQCQKVRITEASLYIEYVFLDNDERRIFAKNSDFILVF